MNKKINIYLVLLAVILSIMGCGDSKVSSLNINPSDLGKSQEQLYAKFGHPSSVENMKYFEGALSLVLNYRSACNKIKFNSNEIGSAFEYSDKHIVYYLSPQKKVIAIEGLYNSIPTFGLPSKFGFIRNTGLTIKNIIDNYGNPLSVSFINITDPSEQSFGFPDSIVIVEFPDYYFLGGIISKKVFNEARGNYEYIRDNDCVIAENPMLILKKRN